MAKCMSCGKSVLLTSCFANVVLCKNCGSIIGLSEWRDRDFSSTDELLNKKKEVLQKSTTGGISQIVIKEICHYFDEYIDAGFILTIDGKAGQTLKVFEHWAIITTKSEGKKSELENMFSQFDDDDDEIFTSDEKRSLARGLMSGRLVQAGIGAAVSATINKQEKEKISREKDKNIDRLITVGERRVRFNCISSVETYSKANTANGYLKFIHNGASPNTLFDCDYFFFNNSIPFKTKRIKQEVENVKNIITDKISKDNYLTAEQVMKTQFVQQDSTDVFNEVRKYKQLLDEGIITEDEFNVKKKELLNL